MSSALSPTTSPERRLANTRAISDDQQKVIIFAIKRGNFRTVACDLAGVKYDTFRDWMERGGDPQSTAKTKPLPGEEMEPYYSFAQAVRRAEAEAEDTAVKALTAGFDRDWRAATSYLARKHPERWAEKGQAVNVESGANVLIVLPDNGRDPLD